MPLSVLTDDQVRLLLENLTLEELESFREELRRALHDYSTNTQSMDEGLLHQPTRTSIHSAQSGITTLFMPSCSPAGHGVKVITLSSGSNLENDDPKRPVIRPTGAITLFSADGQPVGFLHASTLTAFRTALASSCLLVRRRTVRTLTVFGCGEQAYWHIRLALMFRGATVKHVNIINRRFSQNCKAILKRLYAVPAAMKEREGWGEATFGVLTPGYGEYERLLREQVQAADVLFCCTPSTEPLFRGSILTSHEARLKGRLIVAIGSYTPAMRELPVELLRQATKTHEKGHRHFHKHAPEGGVVVVDTLDGALKEAGEIIEAGLAPTQLVELGELVMLHNIALAEEDESQPSSRNSSLLSVPSAEFEKLDLDSSNGGGSSSRSALSSVFGSEGRSSTSSRPPSPSRKSSRPSLHHRSASHNAIDRQKRKDDHLARWLQEGNVIYKSVGLGLMDLAVGMKLVRFAQEKGVGSHIDGFS
ncbi:hypothetical protein VTK73DRAFT_9186 [Phialemonium thermophilum]|uniref:Ornithine cyclodeaminase n=1 Tax=Phialemonium thermophilum TaxID=223376 RepID=A0ABR3W3Z0_9PEZI